MSTQVKSHQQVDPKMIERFTLKAFVEACLVVEERVTGIRDTDLGLMLGAGMVPGPFAKADIRGLDETLRALEEAQQAWGDSFTPPLILRRLVSQGRLGVKTGQGFYPYPQPDVGYETSRIKLQTRGQIGILWLDNPPANVLSPDVIVELQKAWDTIEANPEIRVMILASPNPMLFCAGADVKEFMKMDAKRGSELMDQGHALFRSWERSSKMTIAAINGLAFGGGCEAIMACDVRLASFSATFAQPEINLGIMPGWGGTQRLPRLVGEAKALEMNTTGEAISSEDAFEHGLVNRLVPDHELFDTAMMWANRFVHQAPVALEQIKQVSDNRDLDEGIAEEKAGFKKVFASEDSKEGIGAFLGKRPADFKGR